MCGNPCFVGIPWKQVKLIKLSRKRETMWTCWTYFPNTLIVAFLVLSVRRIFVVKRVYFGLVLIAKLVHLSKSKVYSLNKSRMKCYFREEYKHGSNGVCTWAMLISHVHLSDRLWTRSRSLANPSPRIAHIYPICSASFSMNQSCWNRIDWLPHCHSNRCKTLPLRLGVQWKRHT